MSLTWIEGFESPTFWLRVHIILKVFLGYVTINQTPQKFIGPNCTNHALKFETINPPVDSLTWERRLEPLLSSMFRGERNLKFGPFGLGMFS